MGVGPDADEAYVINQSSIEAKFAQRLASNEKKTRDRAFKKLRNYLMARSMKTDGGFKRDEMLRIWKGLFYCMWMSDKPLVQEELASSLADILSNLRNIKTSMMYFETFLSTIHREWNGIDRLRMDKFLLLTRFMLKSAFKCADSNNWEDGIIDWLVGIMKDGPLCFVQPGPNKSTGPPLEIRYHFSDIYLDELTEVGHETLTEEKVLKLIQPCCRLICNTPVKNLRNRYLDGVFQVLIDQSEPALKLVEEVTKDFERPEKLLNINYGNLADLLFDCANKPEAMGKNRKKVYKLVQTFRGISNGRMPLDHLPELLPDNDADTPEVREKDLTRALSKQWIDEYKERKEKKKEYRKSKSKNRAKSDNCDDGYFGEAIVVAESNRANPPVTVDNKKKDAKEGGETLNKKKKKKKKKNPKNVEENKETPNANSTIDQKQSPEVSVIDTTVTADFAKTDENETIEDELKLEKIGDGLNENESKLAKTKRKSNNLSPMEETNMLKESKERDDEVVMGSNLEEEDVNMEDDGGEMETTINELISPKKSENKTENSEENVVDNGVDSLNGLQKKKSKLATKSKKRKILESNESDKTSSSEQSESTDETLKSKKVRKTSSSLKKKKGKKEKEGEKNVEFDLDSDEVNKPQKNDGNSFAKFKKSTPPASAFIKVARAKVNKSERQQTPKASSNKRKKNIAQDDGSSRDSDSSKRVSFEMSKIQVQPFRKNQKPSACSPSPLSIAFDPNKTPDFSLLKVTTRSATKKRARAKAEEFFFKNN